VPALLNLPAGRIQLAHERLHIRNGQAGSVHGRPHERRHCVCESIGNMLLLVFILRHLQEFNDPNFLCQHTGSPLASIIGPEAGGVTIGDQQSSLRSHPVPRAIAHIVSNSYASTRNATDRTDNHSYYWIIILDGAPRRRMLHPEGAVFIPTIGPQSEQVGIFSAHGMNSNSR